MEERKIKKCEYCGAEFVAARTDQKFCCKVCQARFDYHTKNPNATLYKVKNVPRCQRVDCKLYTLNLANHCLGLSDIPTYNCSFYKEAK